MVTAVATSHSEDTREVRKVLRLVAKPREWSCSYGQLNLFVDACGAVLVELCDRRDNYGDATVVSVELMVPTASFAGATTPDGQVPAVARAAASFLHGSEDLERQGRLELRSH